MLDPQPKQKLKIDIDRNNFFGNNLKNKYSFPFLNVAMNEERTFVYILPRPFMNI